VAGEQWKTKGLRQQHSGRPTGERRRRRHLQAAATVTRRGGKWLENPNRPSLKGRPWWAKLGRAQVSTAGRPQAAPAHRPGQAPQAIVGPYGFSMLK
jgi:hypothetical protein